MFSKVLAALCEAGNMKKGRWLFDDGVESGLIPDMNFLRESHDLFHHVKERGMKHDLSLSWLYVYISLCGVGC
ncbi:pentatricopeptide repeat-containing protein [Quercus suber]|uniref:Pentatricopeptide repeat-containing protein n=1 Tax=Quercus suber TaxID=58331 RepID=A0AAW0M951_QUESU